MTLYNEILRDVVMGYQNSSSCELIVDGSMLHARFQTEETPLVPTRWEYGNSIAVPLSPQVDE
jgi:hypothetical protein